MKCDCRDAKAGDQPQAREGRQTGFFEQTPSIPVWLLASLVLMAANMLRLSFS